jgi:hypothetical protein
VQAPPVLISLHPGDHATLHDTGTSHSLLLNWNIYRDCLKIHVMFSVSQVYDGSDQIFR